jgi:hypothetical protein
MTNIYVVCFLYQFSHHIPNDAFSAFHKIFDNGWKHITMTPFEVLHCTIFQGCVYLSVSHLNLMYSTNSTCIFYEGKDKWWTFTFFSFNTKVLTKFQMMSFVHSSRFPMIPLVYCFWYPCSHHIPNDTFN